MQANGVVASELAGDHWDLGLIPRSTQYLFHIFLNMVMCRLLKTFHQEPHASACHVATITNPMAKG